MSMDWVPGLDLAGGTLTLPLWAAAVAAALVVALIVIAILRSGLAEFGSLLFRAAIIVTAVVLGWTFLNRGADRDRADERRALDQRAADLVGRAIAPGSAIACLEATSGDAVEGGCERAVFTSPETLAAATSYVSARLALLSDAHDFAARRDSNYESSIASLRRMIAADRFGLVSQVLSARDGCTADACDAFNLVYDDKRLRANLRERTFDLIVARYAVNWPSRTPRPVASTTPSGAPPTTSSNLQFPSSQSIPPVSIMNNEPVGAAPVTPPQDNAAAPPPTAATTETKAPPTKRPRPPANTAATTTAPPPAAGPMSLAPAKQN